VEDSNIEGEGEGENSYQDRFRPCLRDSSVGK